MKRNERGTWDYFYAHATRLEKDAVTQAKRLEWCGSTPEEEAVVAEATAVLEKYDLL